MQIRTLALSLLILASATTGALARADGDAQRAFDIPAQPLAQALKQFADQTGLQLAFETALTTGRTSPEVKGEFSTGEALKQLLQGTGLRYDFLDDRTVAVSSAAEKSISKALPISGVNASFSTSEEKAPSSASRMRLARAEGEAAKTDQTSVRKDELQYAELEEIVVTAQKREERLRDVPMAVAVIGTESLTRTNQLRVQDYIARVPGVSFAPSGNGGEPTVVVRGIVTGAEANPTVGYVVDDVPYGSSTATGPNVVTPPDIDPGDLARIEVLRGPQGTLYGAASIGGLVHFVTRDPSTEALSGRIELGTSFVADGDDFGLSLRGTANVPISDRLAVRVSAFDFREPGYIDNAQTGEEDINSYESSGVRASTLWQLNSAWSIRLNGFMQNSERGGVSDIDTTLGGRQQAFLTGTGVYERRAEGYSATVRGDIGPMKLTSVTGYNMDRARNDIDISFLWGSFATTYFGVDNTVALVEREADKFSQEFRLSTPIAGTAELLVGAFFTEEDVTVVADNQAADATGVLFGSIYKNNYSPAEYKERALFANLTFDLTSRWQAQLGGRASDTTQALQATWTGPLAPLFFGSDPFTTGVQSINGDSFTYSLVARYEFTPDVMAYSRISTGYRPGGPNVACGVRATISCGYDADDTRNFELGSKGRIFGSALDFDVAVYFTQWNDIQIPNILVPPDFLFFYTDNAAQAESKGVELSLEARPVSGVRLFGAAWYNEAELTSDFPLGSTPASAGERLPFSPRWSANAGFEWDVPLNLSAELTLGATATYVGDRIQGFTFVGARERLASYTQIDLRAQLDFSDWTWSLFANNVADRQGALRSSFPRPDHFTYTQPRTFGISLAKDF